MNFIPHLNIYRQDLIPSDLDVTPFPKLNVKAVRVVLWDEQVRIVRKDDYNIGRVITIVNGYTKQGKTGIEIHISTFGRINFLPEDETQNQFRILTKRKITKRLDFLKDTKSHMIPCPFCGLLSPSSRKSCGKCGEPLPQN